MYFSVSGVHSLRCLSFRSGILPCCLHKDSIFSHHQHKTLMTFISYIHFYNTFLSGPPLTLLIVMTPRLLTHGSIPHWGPAAHNFIISQTNWIIFINYPFAKELTIYQRWSWNPLSETNFSFLSFIHLLFSETWRFCLTDYWHFGTYAFPFFVFSG